MKLTPTVQNCFQNWSVRNWQGMGYLQLFTGVCFQLLHWFGMNCPYKNGPKDSSTFPNQFILNRLALLLNRPRKNEFQQTNQEKVLPPMKCGLWCEYLMVTACLLCHSTSSQLSFSVIQRN